MSDDTTTRVRVPARAWIYIEGTQAWADRDHPDRLAIDGAEACAVWRKVEAAKILSDGSCMVPLTRDERLVFLDYATAWILGAGENAGPHDMDALADYRSLSSLIRHLTPKEA